MAREEILDKLNKELEKDIHNECQVVCILSRIRKILEMKSLKSEYKYLKFYCNWTLHHKLDHKNSKKLVSDLFEQDIDCDKGGKENATRIKSKHSDFFKLSSLKRDLNEFLKKNDLSVDLLSKNKKWRLFTKLLLEIIKECPIVIKSEKLNQLELIKNNRGYYCYKFSLTNRRYKPIIKLKFK